MRQSQSNDMKVLIINSVCGVGSTGRIAAGIAGELEGQGHEVKIAFGRKAAAPETEKYAVRIGSRFSVGVHFLATKLLDRHGLCSIGATRRFLSWAEGYDPDLLWLHNIHGYYINYIELFRWIKSRPDMEVRWTLHDCWAFTGHCSHFLLSGCGKWKTGCSRCISKQAYPSSILADRSKKNYRDKERSFTGVKNLKIITPSNWLKGCVRTSFLREYEVETVYNRVDEKIFRPVKDRSKIKEAYKKYLKNGEYDRKKIVLGVAGVWTKEKGYEDFRKLSGLLPKEYQVVLVGLSKQQVKKLPDGMTGVPHTSSQEELSLLYNGAYCYVNLTYEDTFPTTNLEAAACGVPVITYDTGGCRETVGEKDYVVRPGELGEVSNIITGWKSLVLE